MSATYEKLGLKFLYPENWQIADEDMTSWPRTVSVHSPSGAFWSLVVHDRGEPQEMADSAKTALSSEYEDLESTEFQERLAGFLLAGYEMFFYCAGYVVNARVLSVRVAGQVFLLVWQAEDRDFQELEPVFRAITTSLLRELEPTALEQD